MSMKNMTPVKLAQVTGGTYYGPSDAGEKEITCLVSDNRQIEEGGMFVAIKGQKVDGNKFIPAAYESGALCCVSEDKPLDEAKPYIQVASCFQALKDMASYYREQFDGVVIGITGSVGKTTTKEMIASVLSTHFNTLKTLGNFNNEVGLPLTVFRIREEHQVAILEMGISDFGEMTRLTNIGKPNHCVITNVGQCHLENLGDLKGVLKAKTEIFKGLKPGGNAYLMGDDPNLSTVTTVNGKKPVFFGISPKNAVYPSAITSLGLQGTKLTVESQAGSFEVVVPVPGKHMITNALGAIAIALDLGLSKEEIVEGIAAFKPVDGHGSVFSTDKYTVMDDCYNANPVSMKAGLNLLSEVKERKVAILGDMFELGTEEKQMHYEVGTHAASLGIDTMIVVGDLCKELYNGVLSTNSNQEIHYFKTLDEALDKIPDLLQSGDAILVKASHGMHFEKIVAKIREL